jgi:NAD dependent epimerase/dehydratase family enzyme
VRNAEFAKALGRTLHRPSWLPVPALALRTAVGEFSEYLLNGRRVVPARLRELGFSWKHGNLAEALSTTV